MDDGKIIELYFSRDEKAIEETQKKYGTRLLALSVSITDDRLDSEECVNDTYLRIWNSIPPTRPKHFFGFIAKIVRNISLDVLDRRSAQKRLTTVVELSHELEECIPSDTVEDSALGEALNSFLRELEDDAQYIFVRRYFYSEPLSQIAARTGRSETAVTSLLYRTRKQLKKHLQNEGVKL